MHTGTDVSQTRPDQTQSSDPDPLSLPLTASDLDLQSKPRAVTAHQWYEFFKSQWWISKGAQYGQGEADAKACARLGDLLKSLPDVERALDWEARERIVAEFLGRADAHTVQSGWSFAFFASGFNGLRIPPESRPQGNGKRSKTAGVDEWLAEQQANDLAAGVGKT
jgi:hypothetical protein